MNQRGNANLLQRVARSLSATAPVSWLLAHTLHHVDGQVFRLTGGRRTFSSFVTGLPVVMLTTTGARSGKPRTVPVLGLPDGDRIVVFASGYGRNSRPPGWYYNLRAHPEAELAVDGVTHRVLAYEAGGEERERLWREALEVYPGFAGYQQRVGTRRIPVMVLSLRA